MYYEKLCKQVISDAVSRLEENFRLTTDKRSRPKAGQEQEYMPKQRHVDGH